jgi:hypothetical protein
MSLKQWGIFLDSFKNKKDAQRFIAECNQALAHMEISHVDKMSLVFEIHPTFDNARGRQWLYGVWMNEEKNG